MKIKCLGVLIGHPDPKALAFMAGSAILQSVWQIEYTEKAYSEELHDLHDV